MRTTPITRRLGRAGFIAGLSALALLSNPTLGSAVVTGDADVSASGNVVTVTLTNIKSSTATFAKCTVAVFDSANQGEGTDDLEITGDTAAGTGRGTFVTNPLPDGEYRVVAFCEDDGSVNVLTEGGFDGEPVTVPAADPGALGSLEQLLDLFGM